MLEQAGTSADNKNCIFAWSLMSVHDYNLLRKQPEQSYWQRLWQNSSKLRQQISFAKPLLKNSGTLKQRLRSARKESLYNARSLTEPYRSKCRSLYDNESSPYYTISRFPVAQNNDACRTQCYGTTSRPTWPLKYTIQSAVVKAVLETATTRNADVTITSSRHQAH